MDDLKRIAPWLLAGLAAVAVIAWTFPQAYPFFPAEWSVTHGEARQLGLDAVAQLGEVPDDPYVVVQLYVGDGLVERRLLATAGRVPVPVLADSEPARQVASWLVTVYRSGARANDWLYRARVGLDGTLLALAERVEPTEARPTWAPGQAIEEASRFLEARGVDLSRYERPQVRSQELENRTDLTVRFPSQEQIFQSAIPYGLEVTVAGDRIVGFEPWIDDPAGRDLQAELEPFVLWSQFKFLTLFLIAPLVSILFVRRYHAGEVGVHQGGRIFLVLLGLSLVVVVVVARAVSETGFGFVSRQWATFQWGLQFLAIFFLPLCLVSFLSWSVGESLCRERWSDKLAPFDALLKRRWANATVARASVRGVAAGLVLLAVCLGLAALLAPLGVGPQVFTLLVSLGGFKLAGAWPLVALVAFSLLVACYRELFGRLLLVSYGVRRLGTAWGPAVAVLVGAFALFPAFSVLPLTWAIAFWVIQAAFLVMLFWRYDLLTVLVASLVLELGASALFLVFAEDPSLQLQGWLALAVPFLPALVSLRALGSGRELRYQYDDVPAHVRRIAERERQRVELETARRIQSSILPELPPSLNGVELAHSYLPASEVGGDFYDVLALEDGRLAVAVGDVAGHGVSSGLVMAAVKSALSVQVSFQPDVESVLGTLNRMVYQSSRRRLITTLCYALVDPLRREVLFASAGHIFPYRVSADGRVTSLVSVAYPLGVRPELVVPSVRVPLAAGDTLVLLSDGIIEARAEGSTDLYGFDRLEASIERHAQAGVERLKDGILDDLVEFTGSSEREDDQTLLIARLPRG